MVFSTSQFSRYFSLILLSFLQAIPSCLHTFRRTDFCLPFFRVQHDNIPVLKTLTPTFLDLIGTIFNSIAININKPYAINKHILLIISNINKVKEIKIFQQK